MQTEAITKQFKENIKQLVKKGQLKSAKALLVEYQRMVPKDIEIYSIMGVILLIEGNVDEAESTIHTGLVKEKNDIDLLYNLAYIYEIRGEYLKALETYENMVFHMEDTTERIEMIKVLNELEDKHRDEIQRQWEKREDNIKEITFNGKKRNLHLMYDSQYCDRFIYFVNKYFPNDQHLFIIIVNGKQKLKLMNITNVENVKVLNLQYDFKKLMHYIDNCSRIFIHYLFDYFCSLMCRFDIKKPIYWPLWGGDVYNYIDFELFKPITKDIMQQIGLDVRKRINKNDINYIYRKVTIRKIKKILRIDDGDYEKVRDNFITKAERLDLIYFAPTFYNSKMIEVNFIKKLKSKYEHIILLGNSANPTNNHFDILYKLKKVNSKNFCIIAPLSYGGPEWYIKVLINEGTKIFGERFIPLTKYYSAEEYSYILDNVSVCLFAHNRQQGLGNIWTAIMLRKKVYLDNKKYTFFKKNGIKVYSINDINKENIEEITRISDDLLSSNKKRLAKLMDIEIIKKYLHDIFDN
ncbi:MAG: TDP-N-acetylfucosamine:lipid II N-acetylfucosaminyltransferase [Peptococcaceae bacterium]